MSEQAAEREPEPIAAPAAPELVRVAVFRGERVEYTDGAVMGFEFLGTGER